MYRNSHLSHHDYSSYNFLSLLHYIADVFPLFQDGDNSKPLTLPEPGSHMVYQAADITANSLQFKLQFRTFDKDRLLLWNEMNRGGSFIMRIGQEGHIEFEMLANEQGYVIKEIAKSGELDNCHPILTQYAKVLYTGFGI